MALEIQRIRDGVGEVDLVTVDRHWYLTEDRERVVREGHPDGRWLWATPGMQVSREDAERLGAVEPEVVAEVSPEPPSPDPEAEAETEVPPEPAPKAKPAPANKQRSKPPNKAADGGAAD